MNPLGILVVVKVHYFFATLHMEHHSEIDTKYVINDNEQIMVFPGVLMLERCNVVI